MYKLDKSVMRASTHAENEIFKRCDPSVPVSERLRQAWFLIAHAYGIDPLKPPPMDKTIFSVRKHAN